MVKDDDSYVQMVREHNRQVERMGRSGMGGMGASNSSQSRKLPVFLQGRNP